MVIAFIFIFSATLFWALVNIIDKHITGQRMESYPVALCIAHAMVQVLFIPVMLIVFISDINTDFHYTVPLIGILDLVATYFYYKGIKNSEASVFSILLKTSPIFVLLFSFILLGSTFDILNYVGMFCFLIASFIIYDFKKLKKVDVNRSVLFIILSACLIALSSVLRKISINNGDTPFTIVLWSVITMFIIAIPLFVIKKKSRVGLNRIFLKNKRNTLYYGTSGLFEFSGVLLYTFSINELNVSIASFISSSQPVFVFVISAFLTLKKTKSFKEDLSIRSILIKSISIFLILLGTILVY